MPFSLLLATILLNNLIEASRIGHAEAALVVLGKQVISAAGILDAFQSAVTFELVFEDFFVEGVHCQEGAGDVEAPPVVAGLKGLFQVGLEGGNEPVFIVGFEFVDKGICHVFEQGAAGDQLKLCGIEGTVLQLLPDDPIVAEKGFTDAEGIAVVGKEQFDAVDIRDDVAEMVEGHPFDILCLGRIFFGPEFGGDLFRDDALSLCTIEQDEEEELLDLGTEQVCDVVAFAIEGSEFAEQEDRIGEKGLRSRLRGSG